MVTLCRRSGSLSTLLVVVNAESDTKSYRDVFCLSEYSVTTAEILIPASDVVQHISIAGVEASKTSNMKFCLNGGLLLGTADGPDTEIAGNENVCTYMTGVGFISAQH
ncbi:hypothetical protein PISMIDRAFT_15336 [Pisolithus microcarpus 441]|uniref:Alpha-1,4 glucan phosphorylase n=1 Tax=Pisolithus microcarpus 441 TaxID=765257 RepID=A0A0C9Z3Y9_9AGAM|nr:hypothetical protein PISMIDRAFT_15336 [Pisolithus microcarpus 441]